MKISAVLKASSLSFSYPGRYAVRIADFPLFEYLVNRIRSSRRIGEIVLATSDDGEDDVLAKSAEQLGIGVFRGKYDDSLGRLYGAAALSDGDIIVKVWGHYPLVDPWETDKLIEELIASDCEFGYNEHYNGIIFGLGVEVMTFDLIEKANREIKSSAQRKFGSDVFRGFVDRKKTLIKNYKDARPDYRVTLAVPNDLIFINQIAEKVSPLNYRNIHKFLDKNPILVNYAKQNIAGAKEVGIEKIMLYPQKTEAMRNSYADIDLTYPISVELSLTNRCNLKCKWCSDFALRNSAMVDIDFAIIRELFRDLSENGTKGIVIEGGGEPTIYPQFRQVVECAMENNLKLGIITNGVEIPYADYINSFDWIRISLDAADKTQFQKWKGDNLFDNVINNIETLFNRRNKSVTTIGAGYVLTKYNEDGLEELMLKLRNIVDYIQIRLVIDHETMMPQSMELGYLEKYSTSDFTVNIANVETNAIKGNLGLPCVSHSLSSVIAANGDVFLCGRLNKYDWFKPIGSLKTQSFNEIWLGEERLKQTKTVLDSNFCLKFCPECRLTKYNILFDSMSKIKTSDFI